MRSPSMVRLYWITAVAMLAFAANSLLCRGALAHGNVSAGTFTLVRLLSGATVLALLTLGRHRPFRIGGSWRGAVALVGYAGAFSYAYNSLSAATGALLLFGAVQVTMIVYGLWSGERINRKQIAGVIAAGAGLIWLLLPGVQTPPLGGAILMLGSGFFWGVYSLLGRGAGEPTVETTGNFIRSLPLALVLFLVAGQSEHVNAIGFGYAAASGALASGLGYALWYAVLPALSATTAAMVQLSVPVLAAFGGVALLGEAISGRFVFATVAVLGGIALFVMTKSPSQATPPGLGGDT